MDVEKPKRCSEGRNLLHPNTQARHRHRRNSHQPSQHWKWPQNGYEQHQIERRGKKANNWKPRVDATQIGPKKIEFQLELRNRFETLQELYDIDTMCETITDMIQQSASRVAKTINKPLKSRISLPTRALMTKRREMVGNGDDKTTIIVVYRRRFPPFL